MELQYLVFIWYFNFVLIQFFFCYAFPLERVYLYCSIVYLKCATSILILQGFKIRSAWLLKKIWNVDSWRIMVLFKLWTLKDRLCEFCIMKYIWKFRHQKCLNCMMLKLCVCVSSGKEWSLHDLSYFSTVCDLKWQKKEISWHICNALSK